MPWNRMALETGNFTHCSLGMKGYQVYVSTYFREDISAHVVTKTSRGESHFTLA